MTSMFHLIFKMKIYEKDIKKVREILNKAKEEIAEQTEGEIPLVMMIGLLEEFRQVLFMSCLTEQGKLNFLPKLN